METPMTIAHRSIVPLLALGLGVAIGRAGTDESTAHADTTRSPPRVAFKSGAARSESLLVEIRDTLKKIDERSRASRIGWPSTNVALKAVIRAAARNASGKSPPA